MSRQKFNFKLLRVLYNFIKLNPDFRFVQALWALGIVNDEDRFYRESKVLYRSDIGDEWKDLEVTDEEFFKIFDIEPKVITYCSKDCLVEPSVMKDACPNCEFYTEETINEWPVIDIMKLIKILVYYGCGCLISETEVDKIKQEVLYLCIINKDLIYNEVRKEFIKNV